MNLKKTISHKPIEVCPLCKKNINCKEDNWTIVWDLLGKETRVVKFYHASCMNDLITAKGKIIQKNFENRLKDFTSKMFGDAKAGTFNPEQMKVNLDQLSH